MDGTDVARRVRARVGDTAAGVFVTDADVIDCINDAQLAINREAKVITDHHTFSTVADTGTYALPTDFLSARSLLYNDEKFLHYLPAQEFRQNYPPVGNRSGRSEYFSIEGFELLMYAVPDGVYACDLHYVAIPPSIAAIGDDLTLPLFLHPHVVDYTYALFKERDEDYEAAMAIKAEAIASVAISVAMATSGSEDSFPSIRDTSDVMYYE